MKTLKSNIAIAVTCLTGVATSAYLQASEIDNSVLTKLNTEYAAGWSFSGSEVNSIDTGVCCIETQVL